jgi:hypothetical protein
MIGMGNDSSCGCILGNCRTVAEQVPVAASQCYQPKWACGDPLIFEGLRIHPPNPMEGHVSALIRRKRVIRGDADDSDGLVGSVLPGRHIRTRIREVRLIRLGH